MTVTRYKSLPQTAFCLVLCLALTATPSAQPPKAYTIRNGKMYIQLPRVMSPQTLDSFIVQFDLSDLGLRTFLKRNNADSLKKLGWTVEVSNETGIVLSKELEPFTGFEKPAGKHLLDDKEGPRFPVESPGVQVGINRFRNKSSFYRGDSIVRFFLRGQTGARKAYLAGSFNNWRPAELLMKKTDSGWIYERRLGAGKWWYKFVVDGQWQVDADNAMQEEDGYGNVNSVFFRPNTVLMLTGAADAKKVFVAGSFNNWKQTDMAMTRTANGWRLPLYLAQGTHLYKFLVDGVWTADPSNPKRLPDGQGAYNSVLHLGQLHRFALPGFANATKVTVAGSFNNWRDFELPLMKTASGWELRYAIGPGNYEYKFKVDGKWMKDPANAQTTSGGGSVLVLAPNYTFRLKGFGEAKAVMLAGDFNNWDPKAYTMKRRGDEWVFAVHLPEGKHLYKFVVDGKWITDPNNKLWEPNEYGTGNSIVWMEPEE